MTLLFPTTRSLLSIKKDYFAIKREYIYTINDYIYVSDQIAFCFQIIGNMLPKK
jgi:hypothetical protein